jgi:DNA-directed RNA polymerase subunit RPC12/RpoP
MTPMTQEEYIRDPNQCPHCRSRNIVGRSGLDAEAGVAWQVIGCRDCGARWQDEYKLVGYVDLE